jgi:hypothetical protein
MEEKLRALAAKWRAEADRLLDQCCRTGKWFSSMESEEQNRFREAQSESHGLFACSNELLALIDAMAKEKR